VQTKVLSQLFAQSVQLPVVVLHTKKSPAGAALPPAAVPLSSAQSLCCAHSGVGAFGRWQLPFTHVRLFGHALFALQATHAPLEPHTGVGFLQSLGVQLVTGTHWALVQVWPAGQFAGILHCTQVGEAQNGVLGVEAQSESPLQPLVGLLQSVVCLQPQKFCAGG
jgi:hypothetical protein